MPGGDVDSKNAPERLATRELAGGLRPRQAINFHELDVELPARDADDVRPVDVRHVQRSRHPDVAEPAARAVDDGSRCKGPRRDRVVAHPERSLRVTQDPVVRGGAPGGSSPRRPNGATSAARRSARSPAALPRTARCQRPRGGGRRRRGESRARVGPCRRGPIPPRRIRHPCRSRAAPPHEAASSRRARHT